MTRLQRWLYRMGVRRPLWWSGSNNRTRVVERSLSELSGSPWNLMEDFNDLVGVTNVDDFKFVKGSQSNARISNIECIGLVFINNLLAGRGGLRGKEKVDTLRRFRSAIVQKFGGNTEPFVSTKSQNARLQELGRKSWKITKLREPDGSEAGRDFTAVSSAISQITTWLAAYAAADFTNEEVSFACERVVQFAFEQEMVTSGVKEDKPRR